MDAIIKNRTEDSFTIQFKISYNKSNMLDAEEQLQKELNEVGVLASKEILNQFDTDGSEIEVKGIKQTSKGLVPKEYQTPYGAITVDRHVYQSSEGGKTYVPLDFNAKIVIAATPKFAKMVSSKYACDAAPGVQRDFVENHNRPLALSYIKNLTDFIGSIALAKEDQWNYKLPEMEKAVASISVGMDGTTINMMEDGWREAMVGTIAFYDKKGDRMHTIYTAASPEYGKEKFLNKLEHEVNNVIELFPKVPIIGLADGASANWAFLEKHCDVLTLDFWHASEYLAKAANILFPKKADNQNKNVWLENSCSKLKNVSGSAARLITELTNFRVQNKIPSKDLEILDSVITYFTNQKARMKYSDNVDRNLPIGSGVTEAACKSIVKLRMCKGSARWKDEGATVVLTLRSLHSTPDRWHQFWDKIGRYGFEYAA